MRTSWRLFFLSSTSNRVRNQMPRRFQTLTCSTFMTGGTTFRKKAHVSFSFFSGYLLRQGSLFFQNSFNGYLQLHSKLDLLRLVQRAPNLSSNFPVSYLLDREADVRKAHEIMQEESSVGRYFVKSDSQGQPGLTDQVHLVDDWLRKFWAQKLDPSKSPWLEDLVKINMLHPKMSRNA